MRVRSTLAVAALFLATTLPLAPAASAAVTPVFGKFVSLPDLAGLNVQDALLVGSEYYVAASNQVSIFRLDGTLVTTVTGQLGASSLAVDPTGGKVFVSRPTGTGIGVIDTTTHVATTWLPTTACVIGVATTTTRLFFLAGCATSTVKSLQSVAVSDGAGLSVSTLRSDTEIRAAANRVVTCFFTPYASCSSFAATVDGTLTQTATVSFSTIWDFDLSIDGSYLLFTNYMSYGLARYNATDMTPAGTYPSNAYPEAVAFSPDGSQVAVGLAMTYNTYLVSTYDSAAGTVAWQDGPVPPLTNAMAAVRPRTMQYSADGSSIYGVVSDGAASPSFFLMTATATGFAPPTPTPIPTLVPDQISLNVTGAVVYGQSITITESARPGMMVHTNLVQNNVVVDQRDDQADANGLVVLTAGVSVNGQVVATTAGDMTHLPATASANFTVRGVVKATMTGYKKIASGIAHYATVAKVRTTVRYLPSRGAKVAVLLQYKYRGKWKNVAGGTKYYRYASGAFGLKYSKLSRKIQYRILVTGLGDSQNTQSARIASRTWVID